MPVSSPAQARSTNFFGQKVVWSAFVVAVFGWGVGFYGPPVYMQAVLERTGWSLTFVSSMVTLHFLFGAFVIANMPRLYARFGLPAVIRVGVVSAAIGVLGWSLATRPWHLALAALLTGGGWVTMGAAAVNAIIAPWFVRTRPAALSMAYNGASIGGVILAPLWAFLIAGFSFPVAAALIAGVMVGVVAALSYAVLPKTPETLGQLPDGDTLPLPAAASRAGQQVLPAGALWRNRSFLTLASGMALGLFAQIGLIAHLFSILVPSFGPQVAGVAMALVTACAIGGRILIGRLMPPGADRRLVTSVSYGIQLAGSLVLLASGGQSTALLIVGIILFGSGVGNATSLPPLIAQTEFAKEDVQRVVSLIVAMSQAVYAFAPAFFGLLRAGGAALTDHLASGTAALFLMVAMIQSLAVVCFLAGRRPPRLADA